MENMLLNVEILSISNKPKEKIPYGVKMIGAELEWLETKGKGIKVAVLDTGCPNHKDIKNIGNVFTANGLRHSTDAWDRQGHATHVAGTICANGEILGVLPEATLYPAKVLDDLGGGSDDTIAQGVEWAITQKVHVINMSLGGINPQLKTHEAIKKAVAQGIKVICASGNAGYSWMGYPARFPETIAVASVDPDKMWSQFSSIGEEVELCALGSQVESCYLDNKYAVFQGTSMACPHIAGAVGLFDAKSLLRFGRIQSLDEIRNVMHIYAEDLGDVGRDKKYGFGLFSFGRFGTSDGISIVVKAVVGKKDFYVNGKQYIFDIVPEVKSGRTLIPLRSIHEAIGDKVDYNGATQEITITRG